MNSNLPDLEQALKANQVPAQKPAAETISAEEVLAVRGDLPTIPIELTESKLRRIEVKFNFTNPKHIPQGIPWRKSDQRSAVPGEQSAKMAYSLGHPELAGFERHRKGAYDTGEPVVKDLPYVQVATLRRGFANVGLILTGCFCYELKKPGQMAKWVVVMRFGFERITNEHQAKAREAMETSKRACIEAQAAALRSKNEQTMEAWSAAEAAYKKWLNAHEAAAEAVRCQKEHYKPDTLEFDPKTAEMFRALARTTWGHCHVWKNPDSTVTVNMLHRKDPSQLDSAPKYALAVRDRKLAVLDVRKEVEEGQE